MSRSVDSDKKVLHYGLHISKLDFWVHFRGKGQYM